MKNDDNKWHYSFIIPFVTALLYLLCYFYQLSFNDYFSVPSYWVSIDVEKILHALIPFGLSILVLIFISEAVCLIFRYDISKNKDRDMLESRLAGLSLLALSSAGVFRLSHSFWGRFFLEVLVVILFIYLESDLYRDRKRNIILNKFFDEISTRKHKDHSGILYFLVKNLKQYYIAASLILYVSMFGYFAGGIAAQTQITFISIKNIPNSIVINTYDNQLIVTTLVGEKHNVLSGDFELIEPESHELFIKYHTSIDNSLYNIPPKISLENQRFYEIGFLGSSNL